MDIQVVGFFSTTSCMYAIEINSGKGHVDLWQQTAGLVKLIKVTSNNNLSRTC
jgi:hypothetical protein